MGGGGIITPARMRCPGLKGPLLVVPLLGVAAHGCRTQVDVLTWRDGDWQVVDYP